jgi:hypothetical protein
VSALGVALDRFEAIVVRSGGECLSIPSDDDRPNLLVGCTLLDGTVYLLL